VRELVAPTIMLYLSRAHRRTQAHAGAHKRAHTRDIVCYRFSFSLSPTSAHSINPEDCLLCESHESNEIKVLPLPLYIPAPSARPLADLAFAHVRALQILFIDLIND
jgi:hypothetical protein